MTAKLSIQDRIRAKKIVSEITGILARPAAERNFSRIYPLVEQVLASPGEEMVRELIRTVPPSGQRALEGLLQQITETFRFRLNGAPFLLELFALPVILAGEIDKPGLIASRLSTPDLAPLNAILADYYGDSAQVLMVGQVFDKDDIDAVGPQGVFALRQEIAQGLMSRSAPVLGKGLKSRPIQHSGKPGQNWHLRYLVGALVRPVNETLQQLPNRPVPSQEALDRLNRDLSIYLSMHLEAQGTTFDVLLRPPSQLSYALEEGEVTFCLLELEHLGLKRALSMADAATVPVVTSFHAGRRLLVATVGDRPEILWDTTLPAWLGDEAAVREALQDVLRRAGITETRSLSWTEYLAYRSGLAPRAAWLDLL